MAELLYLGAVPVPYTVRWTGEPDQMFVARCAHVGVLACCEAENRGVGKPVFGKPHMNRQREVIAKDWCDLCARPLKNRTKVSLSHARPVATGAGGMCVMQVEPLVHKDCAVLCVKHCPSLKRDIDRGTLHLRHVLKYRPQMAALTEAAVKEFTGERRAGVVGHAKIELIRWIDKELEWLKEVQ